MIIPPYNGFGSIDDTVQNCLSLVPQPPKKDFIKMLENDNKTLRYAASMVPIRPEDKNRRFIITYRLADHMITIYEPPELEKLCFKLLMLPTIIHITVCNSSLQNNY